MRISGCLLLREEYAAPWGVAIPPADQVEALLLGVDAGVRVVAFHLVERGYCAIKFEDAEEAVIEAGEMALCFAGTAHRISQGANPPVVPMETILSDRGNVFRPSAEARAGCCAPVRGVLLARHLPQSEVRGTAAAIAGLGVAPGHMA